MSKPLSLLFAVLVTLLMSATAISIAHSVWFVLLFSILTLLTTGAGFIVRARLRRKQQS